MYRIIQYIARIIFIALVLNSSQYVQTETTKNTNIEQHKESLHITVFVHGAVSAVLALLNLHRALNDKLTDDGLYVAMIKKIRENPLLTHHRPIHQQGFHQIPHHIINAFHQKQLSDEEQKRALYQFTPAYHHYIQLYDKKMSINRDHVYYTFGHLGLLSQNYRRHVAQELYDRLCNAIQEYKKEYKKVTIDIVAHSHGGNVALNLASIELHEQRGLHIDHLVMFGTPIQEETAPYAYTAFFGNVLNCYSEGDSVQKKDKISTQSRKSYQLFSTVKLSIPRQVTEHNQVYDVRMLVNDNKKCIGHANMWLLGRGRPIIDSLDPLPIAVCTPLLLYMLTLINPPQTNYTSHIDWHIISNETILRFELLNHANKKFLAMSENTAHQAQELSTLTKQNWAPHNTSRRIVFNADIPRKFWHAYKAVRADRKQKKQQLKEELRLQKALAFVSKL